MVSNEKKVGLEYSLLENVVDILDGQRKPIKQGDRIKGNVPYYGATGVIDYVKDYIFDEELILLGEDGENIKSRVLPMAFKISGKSWVNNHAHVLKPHSINLEYLMQYLNVIDYTPYITGTAQPKLNQQSLRKIKILIPPLKEQQKIAAILSSVDAAIEKTENIIEKTEEVKKGLMQELLTKGIGHTEFKDSKLHSIPKCWELEKFENVLDFIGSGVTPKGGSEVYLEKGIPFIRSLNVYPNSFKYKDLAYISQEINDKMQRTQTKKNDVLLNITGASIGRCTVIPSEFKIANVNQHVCILRCNQNIIIPTYLSLFINSTFGQSQILSEQAGQTREGLNFQQIRNMLVPLPPLNEQLKIIDVIVSVVNKINFERINLEKLQTLKQGIMQQLLTGQVRVKVDE